MLGVDSEVTDVVNNASGEFTPVFFGGGRRPLKLISI